MAIPVIKDWESFFYNNNEGLGSSYERVILNDFLEEICNKKKIKTVLEAPIFGFTGISGINSMGLAKKGLKTTLIDNNPERVKLIEKVWLDTGIPVNIIYQENYDRFEYPNKSFDMVWNFSALWFIKKPDSFFDEVCRVADKAVLFCVPNQKGIGYIMQSLLNRDLSKTLNLDNVNPETVIANMVKRGWKIEEYGYIDCPPWPDIGMTKDKFLKSLGLGFVLKYLEKSGGNDPVSILPFYKNQDPQFYQRMKSYEKLEKNAPKLFKKFWAHHLYLLFCEDSNR